MDNEMSEKVKELLSDEEYVKKLLSLGSAEAMSKELEKEGIELTAEEIRKIGDVLRKKENGELSEEELEEVSGGVALISIILYVCLSFAGATIATGLAYEYQKC